MSDGVDVACADAGKQSWQAVVSKFQTLEEAAVFICQRRQARFPSPPVRTQEQQQQLDAIFARIDAEENVRWEQRFQSMVF